MAKKKQPKMQCWQTASVVITTSVTLSFLLCPFSISHKAHWPVGVTLCIMISEWWMRARTKNEWYLLK